MNLPRPQLTGHEVASFDWGQRPRVVFGAGAAARVGELARELGGRRALLVTDPGIVAAGHAARVRASLEGAGLAVAIYDAVRENPTDGDVAACLAVAAPAQVDVIVGLGGGSALDTAKGCDFLLTNGGRMADYVGRGGRTTRPLLPIIAMPTTAGTGSECQSFALIADEATHRKLACGDPGALPRVAILDPELTTTQPRRVTACSGLDAVAHAVETAVTRTRTPLSLLFAHEAFALLHANLPTALDRPGDLAARGATQLGAAWAGMAIENSMLGAAHALANPLTARRAALAHGQAVALVLPWVVRWNARDPATRAAYAALAAHARLPGGDPIDALVARLESLLAAVALPSLAESGVTTAEIPELAADAATQWTGTHNPVPVDEAGFRALYGMALAGGRA